MLGDYAIRPLPGVELKQTSESWTWTSSDPAARTILHVRITENINPAAVDPHADGIIHFRQIETLNTTVQRCIYMATDGNKSITVTITAFKQSSQCSHAKLKAPPHIPQARRKSLIRPACDLDR